MALCRREDHTYGQVFNSHVVSWGTTRDWHPYYITDVNGWYFKLELPFSFWRKGLDPETFQYRRMRHRLAIFVQRYKGKLHVRKGWRPV
jgi:hypothetical protein